MHMQRHEADTNVSILWMRKDGLSLGKVIQAQWQPGHPDTEGLSPWKVEPGLLGECGCFGPQHAR